MKQTLFFLILLIPSLLLGQQSTGTILPNSIFKNQSPDTLFYLPKQKLQTLMDREEISAALIQSLTDRNAECDSLIMLKTSEADAWYMNLLETDKLLEESEINRLKDQLRAGRRTKIWFGVGTLAGFFIGLVL
jgi:hypothetical protein